MKRWAFLFYGIGCHLLFLATYAYMAGFVGNFVVPKTIDAPPADGSLSAAVAVNLLLIAMFALQHSVMARPRFKKWWTRFIPAPIERSTYVLLSCIVVVIWMWQWRPIDLIVWNPDRPILRGALWGLFALGWLLVPLVSLMINHFDLFGTRQTWLYFRGKPYTPLPFRTPLLYAKMRHPLYFGWAMAFWAIPTMTVGHLLFAGATTLYMVGAAFIEERDLLRFYGEAYARYRRTVPMFVPALGRRTEAISENRPDHVVTESA